MSSDDSHLSGALRSMAGQVNAPAAPVEEIMRRGRRVHRTRTIGSLVAVGAVVTGAAVVTTMSLGPSVPAYAVVAQADDRISVTVNRFGDPADANSALHRMTGGRVVIVLEQSSCPPGSQGERLMPESGPQGPTGLKRPGLASVDSSSVLTVRPDSVPAGQVLVLTPTALPHVDGAVSWGLQFHRQPGPTCVTR